MALFMKLCPFNDEATIGFAEAFSEPDFLEYQLPVTQRKNKAGDKEPRCRPITFSPKEPTRKCSNTDLWFCTDPEHEGERLHEYKARRKKKWMPLVKPEK